MRYLSLDFDDGFLRSCRKVADIFEGHGLRAAFNVLADPDGFLDDAPGYPDHGRGRFDDWNALQTRGHNINPHGWDHHDLSQMPHDEAVAKLERCLNAFAQGLQGFDAKRCLYAFAYDRSTPALEAWLTERCLGVRAHGAPYNVIPAPGVRKVSTAGWGPDDVEAALERGFEKFLHQPEGWMLCGLHGLDGEGWGPISGAWLDGILGRLKKEKDLTLAPGSTVLAQLAR